MNSYSIPRRRPLTSHQLEKLMLRFQHMVSALAVKKDIRLHANIDQFYYMQKLVELRLLVSILKGAHPDETLLHQKINDRYRNMYCTWKKDVRFFGRYMRTAQHNLTRNPCVAQAGM